MICWVHGAYSSDRSFNYLRHHLPVHERVVFEYSSDTALDSNIERLMGLLIDNPVKGIVGHSLGGVMAALMVKRGYVARGVTLASPLGGFHFANFLPMSQLLLDIGSRRPVFRELAEHDFSNNLLTIVASNDGHSDGVVPLKSQMALRTNKVERVALNHFEVLLDPTVSDMISDHLFN